MKKTFFFLLSLLILISACSDEEGEVVTIADETVVGAWKVSSITGDMQVISYIGEDSLLLDADLETENIDLILDLKEDHTFTSSGGFDMVITMDVLGQTTTQTTPTENVFGQGTWQLDAGSKRLILNDGSIENSLNIKQMTTNSMQGTYDYVDTDLTMTHQLSFDMEFSK